MVLLLPAGLGGCSSDIASSYYFRPSKSRSMLHLGSVGASLKQKKSNPNPIVFHDKI